MTSQIPPARANPPATAPLRRFFSEYGHECVVALAIVVLLVGVGLYSPRFISARNLRSIFSGNAYVAIAAIGMTILIVMRQIDLSVGALIGVLPAFPAASPYPVRRSGLPG